MAVSESRKGESTQTNRDSIRDNLYVQQTGGHRNYEVQFLLSGMTQVFQDRNYNVQKILPDVLPNQQIHHVLCRATCCVGCGNLSDFPTTVLHLSRWCSEEAL